LPRPALPCLLAARRAKLSRGFRRRGGRSSASTGSSQTELGRGSWRTDSLRRNGRKTPAAMAAAGCQGSRPLKMQDERGKVDGISLDGLPRPAPPPPSVWLAAASRISASSGRRTSAREAHPAGEAHPPAKELRDLPAKLVFLHFFFSVSAKLEQRVSTLEDENTTFVYGGCTLCV